VRVYFLVNEEQAPRHIYLTTQLGPTQQSACKGEAEGVVVDDEYEGDADGESEVEADGEVEADDDDEGDADGESEVEADGEVEAEGDGEGDTDGESEVEADGEGDADDDDEGDADGDSDAEGERDDDGEGDTEGEGDTDGESEVEADGEGDSDADGEGDGGQRRALPTRVISRNRAKLFGFGHTPADEVQVGVFALLHQTEDWLTLVEVSLQNWYCWPPEPGSMQKASR
jgi:hypothetical protein